MRKWRNIAARIRRKAIKNYWRNKADDLKANPRSFFKTFTPFLKDKSKDNTDISLKVGDNIVQDQHEVADYRPVTILTSVDKIFEQLLCKQLKNLSEKIFDTFMSAYRTTYSCETTLVRLIEDWKLALDKNKAVAVLSTDMSKAFDSMYPPLLLAKLQAYGLSCHSTTLLKSYFEDRKNRVRLGNVTSGWKTINRGCPQGSALGPVLWNIYQNDLFYEDIESQLSMYADDHQLYSSNEDVEKVTKVLEQDGRTTAEWYRGNHLEGNLSKYEVMVLARSKQDVRDVVIDDFTISQTEQFKLLGVILDRGLNFTDHISLYALQQP